ncbi:hypothetical protein GCM10025768_10180 [Microbacterium pseudoresistens]|uniref:NitT/TauT family transport system substrate-binding protein n=1 Tax=Microbacterium pseudoresistens TaxID=640634 RepID=A0A7Y9JNB2_9MICO|nr:ABC transporter substrate-binding protein [Microbacterium pseudoresistens]NYD54921.1 NitT/TauT family transport system substrate-binding protein [Microbacterium pseudoresistens]
MKNSLRKALAAGAALAASALFLTACSGDSSAGEESGGDGELTKVTVAINPYNGNAPMLYGMQEGVFAEHGLELELVPQTDVAAIISGVASGQYDFGFATVVHVINANLNGIPIRAVATPEGQQKDHEEPEEGNALVAAPGSGITSAGQIEGKALGVVGLASLNTYSALDMIANDGGDPDSVELVQLPFGQMTAALASGDLAAAVIQAPFTSEALGVGAEIIGKPNVETFPNMAVGLITTSQQYIDANEDIVKAFSDANIESQDLARENMDEARKTLIDHLGLTEEAASIAIWGTADPHVNVEGFEKAQDLLIKYGDQTEELDPAELVWPGSLK